MGMDSYKIGLGNLDTKTRRNAESDNVSFWKEEAKKTFMVQTVDRNSCMELAIC